MAANTRRRILGRLAVIDASLFGLGAALALVALLGPHVKVADTEILAGTPTWQRVTMGACGLLFIALAMSHRVRSVPALWTRHGFLGAEPRVPTRYVQRLELVSEITTALLRHDRAVALVGGSGVGKSTLAAWVCHNRKIQRRFPDGVTWLDAAPSHDTLSLLTTLARRLGQETADFTTVEQARDILAAVLAGKRILIILDDVATRAPLTALTELGTKCTVFFTTRNQELATALNAITIMVRELAQKQALDLLHKWATPTEHEAPEVAKALCSKVGNLALAVAMIGAMITRGRTGADVIALIDDDLAHIRAELDQDYAHPTLWAAIDVSINELNDNLSQERYIELAVFAGSGSFTRRAAEALWGLSGLSSAATGDLLARLVSRSLLTMVPDGRYTAQDLQYVALERRVGREGIKRIHSKVLEAYRSTYPQGWIQAADDPYLAVNLVKHLARAERHEELRYLLSDIRWIYAKFSARGLRELLADYSYAEDPLSEAIRRALLLSAPALTADPSQIATQLAGRLMGHPESRVHRWAAALDPPDQRPWLAPVAPTLISAAGPLEQRLSGHKFPISSLAVSPDGSRAVSGDIDGMVGVWDLGSGQDLAVIQSHKGGVSSLAIAADGTLAISGGEDATAQLLNVQTGQVSARLTGHGGGSLAVAISSDGSHGASGGDDGKVRVWDVESGRRRAALAGHEGRVCSVALTASGERAVSGGMDGTVRLWNLATHEEIARFAGDGDPVYAVAVTPDGRYAVTGGYDTFVRIWDLIYLRELTLFAGHRGPVRSVAISADGRRAVSGGDEGAVLFWDLDTPEVVTTLTQHARWRHAVAITGDGLRAVWGGNDGGVRVWNLEVGRKLAALTGHEERIHAVAVTPDGDRGVTGGADGTVCIWDLHDGKQLFNLPGHRGRVHAVCVTPDGSSVISGGSDGTLRKWDVQSGKQIDCMAGNSKSIWSVAVIPSKSQVLAGTIDGKVCVWDLKTGELVSVHEGHGRPVLSIGVTHDASSIIGGDEDGAIFSWRIGDNRTSFNTLARRRAISDLTTHSVAITPDGLRAVTGNDEGILCVWNLQTAEDFFVVTGSSRRITAVAISSDGARVACGDEAGVIRLWDVAIELELVRWDGDYPVTACTLMQGRQYRIAVGDADGSLTILELREPEYSLVAGSVTG
jgi:WD40 repeat protein